MRVNVNDEVTVVLTDAGMQVWLAHHRLQHDGHAKFTDQPCEWDPTVYGLHGRQWRTQLWTLMHVMGPACKMHLPPLFEGNQVVFSGQQRLGGDGVQDGVIRDGDESEGLFAAIGSIDVERIRFAWWAWGWRRVIHRGECRGVAANMLGGHVALVVKVHRPAAPGDTWFCIVLRDLAPETILESGLVGPREGVVFLAEGGEAAEAIDRAKTWWRTEGKHHA